jgi:hypothetical protein
MVTFILALVGLTPVSIFYTNELIFEVVVSKYSYSFRVILFPRVNYPVP